MKKIATAVLRKSFALSLMLLAACAAEKATRWQLNKLPEIGGMVAEVWGAPKVIPTEGGQSAIEFDGVEDGLLLSSNPIAGADAFSIEVEFKPYEGYPQNQEQRFLHLQDPANDKRRLLMELRLNKRGQWFPDFFMRTDSASLTLIDSTKTYPVGEWARMQLRYRNGEMKGFVNGEEILSGSIRYMPIGPGAKTSLGVRMNKVSWFKGAIRSVKWTKIQE